MLTFLLVECLRSNSQNEGALWLLIGRIIFLTRAITSFAILSGRIIFLKCKLQLFACENL